MSCSFPICQCRGTVFLKIWWQVIIVALYTCGVVFMHTNAPHLKVTIPWTLVPILGVATGMLLVFRTNTAYDRYWEARKLWSSMTTAIRNLTRNIWVGVKEPEGETSKILVEKISALNILAAFSYATRNYLRGEYSYEDADLKYLLRHIPKFYNIDCKCTRKRRRSKKDSIISEDLEGIGCSMWCRTCYSTKKYKFTAYDEETPTNIPVELSYLLGAYIKTSNQQNLVDPSLLAALNNALNSLVECLTGFERVLRTPIPLAYSVHLHHCIWIYLLTLPLQLVGILTWWWTVISTSLAAFCLLGVLEIGWEIENPFGRDSNDLPLDDFCRVTHCEINRIMGRKIPSTDVWLMSPANRPLAPDCSLNAPELSKLPAEDLRKLMKRDPVQMKKYFQNMGFIPDDNAGKTEEKKTAKKVASPSTSSASKSQSQTPEKDVSKGKDDEDLEDETSSKRVSFALPDEGGEEDEDKVDEIELDDVDDDGNEQDADEEDVEEEEDEGEIPVENVVTAQPKPSKSQRTEKTEESSNQSSS